MKLSDWFPVFIALALVIWIFWNCVFRPVINDGVVSSFTTSCYPLLCFQTVEFYGGADNTFFVNTTMNIQPNSICHVRTQGLYLKEINCTG